MGFNLQVISYNNRKGRWIFFFFFPLDLLFSFTLKSDKYVGKKENDKKKSRDEKALLNEENILVGLDTWLCALFYL